MDLNVKVTVVSCLELISQNFARRTIKAIGLDSPPSCGNSNLASAE
jgi:hypothetical protein